jgi:PilZ domain
MAPQELMSKTPQNSNPPHRTTTAERRGTRRCKITQLMRIRPSDPEKEPFEDLRGTVSVSRTGVYFQTSEAGYELGMRLFVTMPYSQGAASMSREYLAEVVRVEPKANGMTGIGFKILMEMGMQANHSYGCTPSRK